MKFYPKVMKNFKMSLALLIGCLRPGASKCYKIARRATWWWDSRKRIYQPNLYFIVDGWSTLNSQHQPPRLQSSVTAQGFSVPRTSARLQFFDCVPLNVSSVQASSKMIKTPPPITCHVADPRYTDDNNTATIYCNWLTVQPRWPPYISVTRQSYKLFDHGL